MSDEDKEFRSDFFNEVERELHKHRNASKMILKLIRLSGMYLTSIFVLMTVEFFVIRNGTSKLIGSQTPFWWLGGTLGIASVFVLAYLIFSLTEWLYHNVKKELELDHQD